MTRPFSLSTTVYIMLEDIFNLFHLQSIIILYFYLKRRRHMRRHHRQLLIRRYSIIDRIPLQVRHMSRLVSVSDVDCLSNLRMDRNTFGRLCILLRDVGGLRNGRFVMLEEQVAIFLGILAHHKKNRIVGFNFLRSGETISHYVHLVLRAILKLHPLLIPKSEPVPNGCTDPRWKHFQGCIGALDETYINVLVSNVDKPRYRTRKGQISTNTLAACDRNMRFLYFLPGWEGSAGGSRVLRDAINREEDGLHVPRGNYFLCDNGYANSEGFLTQYKGVRYHLKEWGVGAQRPQNARELFNLRHTRARNIIERAFAVLKMRWGVLRSATFYPIKIQIRMIMACFLLHNFIRGEMANDPLEQAMDGDSQNIVEEEEHEGEFIDQVEPTSAWNNMCDELANSMWFHVMSASTDDGDLIPECACGKGNMRLFCAGKDATHSGRYFYKCPANAKHPNSFLWCDEYHRDKGWRTPTFVLNQCYQPTKKDEAVDSGKKKGKVFPSHGCGLCGLCHAEIRMNFILALIGLVLLLLLLGIIIGKLM
ncbi:hypothetical protein AAHA92_31162 [Salvia divinorum]|uniref:GRF-type domain-containing protein n=1 Tax=Salvia divinorum TaxID=28513 RepID=A0ABD1FT91_SALDI